MRKAGHCKKGACRKACGWGLSYRWFEGRGGGALESSRGCGETKRISEAFLGPWFRHLEN